jgi:hypothetical protein
MFPINPDVSWEGHLWGAVSGVALAFHYRKYIIRRDKFDWEEEKEDDGDLPLPDSENSNINKNPNAGETEKER